jgi:hypothetical protein
MPPVVGAIGAIAGAIGTAASAISAFVGGLGFIGQMLLGVGLSLVQQLLLGGQQKPSPVGIKGRLQTSGVVPRSFPIGPTMTAGSLAYVGTWGGERKVPNAYISFVIPLSDLPVGTLTGVARMWVNDELVTIDWAGGATYRGYRIEEYDKGTDEYLYVRFYDGSQTTADAMLVAEFGDHPTRPWTSNHIGRGIAYAIVTARASQVGDEEQIWSGFPKFKFEIPGIKLYNPRADSSIGGSGSQRWNNRATWAASDNFAVQIYNILRGISYEGTWVYGLQSMVAARLPTASWFAAINECDRSVAKKGGGTEKQYRGGIEVGVNVEPADVIQSALLPGCSGRLAEVGGVYKLSVGAAGSPVFVFDDDDIVSTEAQSFMPILSLDEKANGIAAKYPEPAEAWQMKDAPPRYNPGFEAIDGARRLMAEFSYDAVPYKTQVQRLMDSALKEARRARRHSVPMGPAASLLEPNDIVSWSSTRNGYETKAFRVDGVMLMPNLNVGLELTEVDPADYDWNPETDERETSDGPIYVERPPPLPIIDWSVEPYVLVGSSGSERPAIRLNWDGDVDAVVGVQFQVRLEETAAVIHQGQTPDVRAGAIVLSQGVVKNTDYEARGKYRSSNPNITHPWSDWLPVTSPDTYIRTGDILAEAITAEKIADAAIEASHLMDGAVTSLALAAEAVTAAALAVGSVTGPAIASEAVTAGKIAAGAVTAVAIAASTITGDKIAGNTITGDKIVANTITAKNLVLTDFNNLIPDGDFNQGAVADLWSFSVGPFAADDTAGYYYWATAAAHIETGSRAIIFDQKVAGAASLYMTTKDLYPCSAGDTLAAEAAVRSGSGTSATGFYFRFFWFDNLGVAITPSYTDASGMTNVGITSVYEAKRGTVTVPAGASFFRVRIYHNNTSTTRYMVLDRVYVRKAYGAELIVDGSIVAGKIGANAVTTSTIAADAVTAAKIAVNSIVADNIVTNSITAVKINGLAVTTPKIADAAVTDSDSAYTSGSFIEFNSVNDVQDVTVVVASGQKVLIWGCCQVAKNGAGADDELGVRLRRSSTNVGPYVGVPLNSLRTTASICYADTPGAGTFTYYLRVNSAGGFNVSQRMLIALVTKK